jgi:hypothetical protein
VSPLTELPQVRDCAVYSCAYNRDGCHAGAITVGSSDHAHCETFVQSTDHGAGTPTASARVGACKRADCLHNQHLTCHAPMITIGPDLDPADCLTYTLP